MHVTVTALEAIGTCQTDVFEYMPEAWRVLQPALELGIREVTKKGGITSYSFRGLDGAHARCS